MDNREVKLTCILTIRNIHIVKVSVGSTTIIKVYKPPSTIWPDYVLEDITHPTIVNGYFNSNHVLVNWKYVTNNTCGEMLVSPAALNNALLVFDAKSKGSFRSGRCIREYNHELSLVSATRNNLPTKPSGK